MQSISRISLPHRQDRSDDPIGRFEFLSAQGAVFLAPYLAVRAPNALLTASDVLFALCFLLRLCTGRLSRPLGEWTWLWFGGAILLIGGLFLGSAVNGDLSRATIVVTQYAFALVLVPLALLGRPLDQSVRLIKCAVWGMVVMCMVGIGVWMTGYTSAGGDQFEMVSGNGRLSGFLDNPNFLAILLVLTLPLLWFLRSIRRVGAGVLLLSFVLLLTGVVLTASNTGLFGLVAAALIFFSGRRSFRGLLLMGLLGGALLFWGQTYLPETFQNRVLGAVTSGSLNDAGTFSARQDLAKEAIALSEEHILVGLGADNYRQVSEWGAPVHNAYLILLVEGGALSFVGLLALLAAVLLTALTSPVRPFGGLVTLTVFTMVIVFAGLLNGVAHVYARCWFLPLLLALSPALATRMHEAAAVVPAVRRQAGRRRAPVAS